MALDVVTWLDRGEASHQAAYDTRKAQGYRTLSLCMHGEPGDARYAAVLIKRPGQPGPEEPVLGLTTAQFQQTYDQMKAKGWGPFVVTATGPANDPRFSGVFRPSAPVPPILANLTAAKLRQLNDQHRQLGRILGWADAYGTPGNVRYVALWLPDSTQGTWSCEAVDDAAATMQARFDALNSAWCRPTHVALAPGAGFLMVFEDDTAGAWFSWGDLTAAKLQERVTENQAIGLSPVRIAAQGSGAATRFAAIFAGREDVDPRTFRKSKVAVAVPKIDDAIEALMKANRVRGAAIAITEGTRLVYARGYTRAEAGYPDVQPTTLFRQASVSKTFTALAIYQLVQEGLSLESTAQSILQLKTPAGGPPADPRFAKVTLRHLLEHTSGLDELVLFRDAEAVKAFGAQLPATPAQLASYCASLQLVSDPGAAANYNNTGYFLLGLVVAALRNAGSFEEALGPTLLQPLGMTRVRRSATLVGAQPGDEARYHARPPATAPSVMAPGQPLAPLGYGEVNLENIGGAGGLSAAVTDVARLLAALSLRQNNPVLAAGTIDLLLANAAQATATLPDHGFHGFDKVFAVDAAKHLYIGLKGGSHANSENIILFATGGLSYVLCLNGVKTVDTQWNVPVKEAAEAQDWKGADLFPQFGMKPFPATPAPKQPNAPTPMPREVSRAAHAGFTRPARLRPAKLARVPVRPRPR